MTDKQQTQGAAPARRRRSFPHPTLPQVAVIVWAAFVFLALPVFCAVHLPSMAESAAQPNSPFRAGVEMMTPFANLYSNQMRAFYDSGAFAEPMADLLVFSSLILPGVILRVFGPGRSTAEPPRAE